jgi:hypothetical protein
VEDSEVTLTDRGFVFPWRILEQQDPDENEYFPPDYPVDEALVTPATTETPKQRHTA